MSDPPTAIRPASSCSKPAISRSVVVFPHPEGPSSATISPLAAQSDAPSTASCEPKRFTMPSI
jgi:hypothetical protein